jgi:two-component system phosphate regulon sensor histidine kinase PhoR
MQQRLNKEFKKRTFELEEKMKQSEESDHKIKLIIENLNEAVVAIHPDLRIVFHNQPFQSLLGGEKIVAKHSSFLEIVRNVELNQMLERVLQNKTSEKKIMELMVNSKKLTFEIHVIHVPVEQGSLIVMAFYDLTTFKDSQRMRKEFIANASHQLKTPLTAIQGFADIMIADPDIEPKLREEFLRKIQLRSIEAAELVTKLLKLSKLETNLDELQMSTVNINRLIEQLCHKFEGNMQKQQIQMVQDFSDQSIELQTDPELLRLVLENLIENAIKYSKVNGRVFIHTSEKSNSVSIEIKDEGIGIPDEDQTKIFERFFRSSNAERHTQDGVGIGMAMVDSAMEKVSGKISIQSKRDEGTTVSLSFPKTQGNEAKLP